MEEIRSTEALDREILEDARKKADRILKAAEQRLESDKETWKKKTESDLAELERLHVQRVEKHRQEVMARLPLDKRRARAERSERILNGAMEEYLAKLPLEKQLDLLKAELEDRSSYLTPGPVTIAFRALDTETVTRLMKEILPQSPWTVDENLLTDDQKMEKLPLLVVNGGAIRITASLSDLAQDLLLQYRAELATVLLGEGAIND